MRTALSVLALAAVGFVLSADDAAETPPATEEATPEEAAPEDCEALEDEDAKAKCLEEAKKKAEGEEAEEDAPKKAGKGRSTSGNMDMEGEQDE